MGFFVGLLTGVGFALLIMGAPVVGCILIGAAIVATLISVSR